MKREAIVEFFIEHRTKELAAEEMYEALKRTLAYLNGDDDCDDRAEVYERIEDALAKAEGRS